MLESEVKEEPLQKEKKPRTKAQQDDSETESEDEEVVIKRKPPKEVVQPSVKATPPADKKPEIIQPVNPQYMLRFV